MNFALFSEGTLCGGTKWGHHCCIPVLALMIFVGLQVEPVFAVQEGAIRKNAGQYCVNRETSSGVCHVQEMTESPLGVNILGPYASRKNGQTAMCAAYDAGSSDPKKWSAAAPSGVCDHKAAVLQGEKVSPRGMGMGAQESKYQLQACAVKKTIWTNSSSATVTVTGNFLDECHEPEDEGQVSIYDKSGAQVGTTFKFSKGYPVTVPLHVPPLGQIEYVCHSNSSTQELQCMFDIVVPNKAKLSKATAKDPCSKVFPIPDGADQWTNCGKPGASACGGPDQCSCDATERLVEYSCAEGKYNKCTTETSCSDITSKKRP